MGQFKRGWRIFLFGVRLRLIRCYGRNGGLIFFFYLLFPQFNIDSLPLCLIFYFIFDLGNLFFHFSNNNLLNSLCYHYVFFFLLHFNFLYYYYLIFLLYIFYVLFFIDLHSLFFFLNNKLLLYFWLIIHHHFFNSFIFCLQSSNVRHFRPPVNLFSVDILALKLPENLKRRIKEPVFNGPHTGAFKLIC
jgi:hypothetical protein